MSAAHFEVLPTLALQLAARVEAYGVALRAVAADPRNPLLMAAVRHALSEIRELALPLPAVWSDWGRFVVAHAELTLRWVRDPGAPRLEVSLMAAVQSSAEALIRRAVHWAIVEKHRSPVPIEVAQAFVEWEAARRIVADLRQTVASETVARDHDGTPVVPPDTRELLDGWQAECVALLARATALLDPQSDDHD
jgi:hypothetical protein